MTGIVEELLFVHVHAYVIIYITLWLAGVLGIQNCAIAALTGCNDVKWWYIFFIISITE